MIYDVLDVSRFVINYSNKKDYGISNLKISRRTLVTLVVSKAGKRMHKKSNHLGFCMLTYK